MSGIARAASVDRTFLYRHRDLLAQVHALETAPSAIQGWGRGISAVGLYAGSGAAKGPDRGDAPHARLQAGCGRRCRLAGELGVVEEVGGQDGAGV